MPEAGTQPPPSEETTDQALLSAMEYIQTLEAQPGWKVLMGQLKTDADAAMEELIEADPNNAAEIEQLQNTVKRYRWFEDTPANIIYSGLNVLENQDQENVETEELD